MVAAVENIDVVVPVDADAADLLEGPAGRQFRPVLHRFECVRTVANGSHARAPCSLPVGKLVTKQKVRPAKSSQAKSGYGTAVVLFGRPANSSRLVKAYSAGTALAGG